MSCTSSQVRFLKVRKKLRSKTSRSIQDQFQNRKIYSDSVRASAFMILDKTHKICNSIQKSNQMEQRQNNMKTQHFQTSMILYLRCESRFVNLLDSNSARPERQETGESKSDHGGLKKSRTDFQ